MDCNLKAGYLFQSETAAATVRLCRIPHLWVAVLRQDLQHRCFTALDVPDQDQFTPGNERLRDSPLLHGGGGSHRDKRAEKVKLFGFS